MTHSQHSVDRTGFTSAMLALAITPGWLIRMRQVTDSIPATNGTSACLVIYADLLLPSTSLYIKDEVGYIYLGKTHEVLSLKPNEKLKTVSLARDLRGQEDRIMIEDEQRGYKWNIEESKLSPYA